MPSSNRTDWTPDLPTVGGVLLSRTRDAVGNELGTFTDATRPTAAQVTDLIPKGVSDIALRIGDYVPVELLDSAKEAVAMAVALRIELGYYSDQVAANRSPYQQIKEALYGMGKGDVGLAGQLSNGIQDLSGDPQLDPSAVLLPVYSFDEVDPCRSEFIGWNTRW